MHVMMIKILEYDVRRFSMYQPVIPCPGDLGEARIRIRIRIRSEWIHPSAASAAAGSAALGRRNKRSKVDSDRFIHGHWNPTTFYGLPYSLIAPLISIHGTLSSTCISSRQRILNQFISKPVPHRPRNHSFRWRRPCPRRHRWHSAPCPLPISFQGGRR